jgi:superfamily II DNA or RNA helicase
VLVLETPTKLRLMGYEGRIPQLKMHLTYTDRKVGYEINRLSHSFCFLQLHGPEALQAELNRLEALRKVCLLQTDDQGLWTYSGLAPKLAHAFNDQVVRSYTLPEALGYKLPWDKVPDKKVRYYQQDTHDQFVTTHHAGCEIGTGLGKSFIIELLLKTYGLKALVMVPFKNVAEQLRRELSFHFGAKYVGFFGDGKKETGKLITVGIGASLTKMVPGSKQYEELSRAHVFIADESHMTPAETLCKVCFGLMSNAEYRFFFSGTQVRNDGLDLLLEAITGDIVYRMTVREGVDQGFLAKPIFRMLRVNSDSDYSSKDALAMNQKHLLYNPKVLSLIGQITDRSVLVEKRPVLILVDELEQFTRLLPFLHVEARFAHGGVDKNSKDVLPEEYHKSNPSLLVDQFNAGEYPVLVGTSCISTGTDIKAVKTMIYDRGGKSEIEVKQGVGRVTRLAEGKTDCVVFDFDIKNVDLIHRHSDVRRGFYDEIYPNLFEMDVP